MIAALFPQHVPEKVVDLPDLCELVDRHQEFSAQASAAKKELKAINARLVLEMGDAEAGRLPDGRIVTARTVNRGAHEVKATSFRQIRVQQPK